MDFDYLDDPVIGFAGGHIPQKAREELFDVFEKYGLTRGEWISAIIENRGITLTFAAKKDGKFLISRDFPATQEVLLEWGPTQVTSPITDPSKPKQPSDPGVPGGGDSW